MASLLHSESRRLYSWWWDSHISPKNSKWLQENLTDMDAKVKAMIKLIEEDADSFARRAEMYYKKRPELMKLVEEFYRAYRALAERYDHATGELRQAHRTMAEAFPNQVPYVLTDDSSSVFSCPEGDPQTPEFLHPIHALLDPDGEFSESSDFGISKKGLKQLNEMFGSGETLQRVPKVAEGKSKKGSKVNETVEVENMKQAHTEVLALKRTLEEIQAEKESLLLQYQQSMQKLFSLEKELKDVGGLDERASRAEIEIKILKETLAKLEAERDASLLQQNKCLERISALEKMIAHAQENAQGLNERAEKAETEAQNLKQELFALEAEKETGLHEYSQCLEMISNLEKKISLAEENARTLNDQTERAEIEIQGLNQALIKLRDEKEGVEVRYEQCLERIAKMESEICDAQDHVKRLSAEIQIGATKLRNAEENCCFLEVSNQSLQLEADNLTQKIAEKDQELLDKETELEKLKCLLQDEQSRLSKAETTLQTLQKLQLQSQEEQRALTLELQNKLQLLNDLEMCNHDMQEHLRHSQEENRSLNELNTSSSISVLNLQNEIFGLKELKKKLEEELALQVAQSNLLQKEICHLKEEIKGLNQRYNFFIGQVHSVGLNPESLASSVKALQDENLKLKDIYQKQTAEKEVLFEKLKDMDKVLENNVALDRTICELSGKLEGSGEKVNDLQDSCHSLQGEKAGLVAEKSILLSQLQLMTENMQKLLERNILLENSLSGANMELEGLKTKSKSLEEFYEILKNEKSNLVNERNTLVSQLENVEQRLGHLERRFTRLEEKYTNLEKEKESTLCQVKELWGYLGVEKQEHASYMQSSESRLADLENQVHLLQEESRMSKKQFEEELDKAVKAQVEIFILQKFIEDLEEKNLSMFIECQRHVEAAKLSGKLISELENENLEQQAEAEFLSHEIQKLRMGINQIFRALQFDPLEDPKGIEEEKVPLPRILDNIEDLKCSYLQSDDEKHLMMVENLVLLTFLGQMRLQGGELELEKKVLDQEFEMMQQQQTMLQKSKLELLELNEQLKLEVTQKEQQHELLEARLETQRAEVICFQSSYVALKEENCELLDENKLLRQKFSDLKREMLVFQEENSSILEHALSFSFASLIFESFGTEKAKELEILSEDLSSFHLINCNLKKKFEMLGEKLEAKEIESLHANHTLEKLQREIHENRDTIDQLNCEVLIGKDFLRQKAIEFSEAQLQLRAAHNLNAEFSRTIEELKRDCEALKMTRENMEHQIFELSKHNMNQKKEMERLCDANENLESAMGMLHKELEEQRSREESLSLELKERTNDCEVWEAEASSFYFDLQVSTIHEVLLENKVQELTTVCEDLEEENATKETEIQQMKTRFSFLESELGGLKDQLSAYGPVIASLRENVDSLEQNALLHKKLFAAGNGGQKGFNTATSPQDCTDDDSMITADGISYLLKMQSQIRAVEKVVTGEMDRVAARKAIIEESNDHEVQDSNFTLEAVHKGHEWLPSGSSSNEEHEKKQLKNDLISAEMHRNKPESSGLRNGMLMKDIPLDQVSNCSPCGRSERVKAESDDQMLRLWESTKDFGLDTMSKGKEKEAGGLLDGVARHEIVCQRKSWNPSLELQVEKEVGIDKLEVPTSSSKESNHERNRGKILERLASDAQKLISIQTSVQDLKKKLEAERSKMAKDLEFDRVKRQLQEIEEAVMHLVDVNDQLTTDIEERTLHLEDNNSEESEEADTGYRKGLTERAWNGSEKIGRLELELQSIQYIFLKLGGEKKNKVKQRFPGSKTGIILKDFLNSGRGSGRRRRKGCFCGCVRPSTNEN
ncbi:hypothetical protein K2173_015808 [Erythroxylum novogranatense]|uniref:NAB domain-containing protein n=1 Tax=Erythroxylum novogranatense TaxID=1862640 RepID=A0AAV8TIR6_9ROSI|nr:hypothetical protein K2173_015808 [Erythroxylum novogranatense]